MDRCLLLFMAVLLVQLACGLFLPEGLAPEAGSIDVIVRTSAAAIFGYLLSANFNRGAEAAPSNRTGDPAKGPGETLPDAPLPPEGAKSRIGFSAEPAGEEMDKGTVEFLGSEKTAPNQTPGCLQILMATAIGLFCLAILLLVRTAAWWGVGHRRLRFRHCHTGAAAGFCLPAASAFSSAAPRALTPNPSPSHNFGRFFSWPISSRIFSV